MMLKGVFFLFGVFALAAGDTYIVEDQFGSEYLMVPMPLQRQRRYAKSINLGEKFFLFLLFIRHSLVYNCLAALFMVSVLVVKLITNFHLLGGLPGPGGFFSWVFDLKSIFTSALPHSVYVVSPKKNYYSFLFEFEYFRQTSVDINKNPGGTQVTLGHKGTIFENDKHLVSGGGFVSKQFRPTGPTTLGGGLGYEHKPSGSGINLGASNTRGFGTDFSATGNANLWRSNNGNTRVDAYANYDRHYGGPWGTGRPNYGGGLQFSHRF